MKMALAALTMVLALPQQKGQWIPISESVTSKVKTAWPHLTAGITVDPSNGHVYMAVSGGGLWKSTDQGGTFERIDGEMIGGRCETGAALNVDPERPGRIACFMLDGKSARSLDGGKTWTAINDKSRGFDYVAVDWSDPQARRMFGIRHESGEIGLLSGDGATWKVLDKPWKAFGVFDYDTLVTWRGQGIERSTDGGTTWTKVSDVNPTGRVVHVYKGVGYWLVDKGLISSKDKGATWAAHGGPVSGWFGPYFGKDETHMVVFGKEGFLETLDGGATWKVAAPPPAEKGMTDKWFSNVAWDPKGNIFYISRMGKPAFKYER